ncbi:MAG TPA: DUF262 domain-containing protein [Bdellovibrionales bacterium]|nr:DUF262 domain-containing protein [Bdellovibrionales bacterium]
MAKKKIQPQSQSTFVLERLPEARTESISDLLVYAKRGQIRVPAFQRGLMWKIKDVLLLLDSIHKGLPVGSLLFWKRPAPAAKLTFGPVEIAAQKYDHAWWVVDGQQRLTSLIATLLRSLPLPDSPSSGDQFIAYFDPKNKSFATPIRNHEVPESWVPLPVLLDASFLSEWIHDWKFGKNAEMRKTVFEAGKRIREYKMPLYLVDSDDGSILEEIFSRVNTTGKPLAWADVHDALYGSEGKIPSSTRQLSEELVKLGMGRIDRSILVTCLIATRGLDATRPASDYTRDRRLLQGAAAEACESLKQALVFLKNHAQIPHLRLLPGSQVLIVLSRFFHLHPEPSSRTLTLLTRWVWRIFLAEAKLDERTLLRRAIAGVVEDEEESVLSLISLVGNTPRKFNFPEAFDARSSDSRLILLALASLEPKNFRDGTTIEIDELIESEDVSAFKRILEASKGETHQRGKPRQKPENILIYPGGSHSYQDALQKRLRLNIENDPLLRSHAIDDEAAAALIEKSGRFYVLRRNLIQNRLILIGNRRAGWNRDNDRPSIKYLLEKSRREV